MPFNNAYGVIKVFTCCLSDSKNWHFNGTAMVKWQLREEVISATRETVRFRFKTTVADGVILYSRGTQGDFLALQLKDNRMLLNIDLGQFTILQEYGKIYTYCSYSDKTICLQPACHSQPVCRGLSPLPWTSFSTHFTISLLHSSSSKLLEGSSHLQPLMWHIGKFRIIPSLKRLRFNFFSNLPYSFLLKVVFVFVMSHFSPAVLHSSDSSTLYEDDPIIFFLMYVVIVPIFWFHFATGC